jgi:hypothetical protein
LSRQNALASRSWTEPATAAQAAVSVVPRPRPPLRTVRPDDTDAPGDRDLAGPAAWDRNWATAQARKEAAARRAGDLHAARLPDADLPEPHGLDLGDHDLVDAPDEDAGPFRRRRFPALHPSFLRRLPAAPRRRPALLLAALVVGAVIAALPVGPGQSAVTPSAASGQDYGLGLEETGFAGGVDGAARGEISQAEAQARLDEIAASRAAREPRFVLPTQGRLSTCFCTRWGTMHWGIDLAAPLGTPIAAAADGVVLRAGPASGYGNAIYIQDADGNVEIYGHMRYLFVHAGDVVSAGDLIAKVGSEGQSTGPHLHFELHKGGMTGKPTDPQKWLAARGITVG